MVMSYDGAMIMVISTQATPENHNSYTLFCRDLLRFLGDHFLYRKKFHHSFRNFRCYSSSQRRNIEIVYKNIQH